MDENFDFVTMENYASDMADLSNTAGNAISKLQRDKDEMLKVIVALVESSGGKIAVPLHTLARMEMGATELIIEENAYSMERIFRVRPRPSTDTKDK